MERYFVHETELGTRAADRLDVVSSLIGAYEAKAWLFEAPDAGDAVMTVMAYHNISREKLAPVFGSKSRLSKLLSRKRGLTMAVANRLDDELQIPASILIRPYVLVPRASFERKPERARAGGAGA